MSRRRSLVIIELIVGGIVRADYVYYYIFSCRSSVENSVLYTPRLVGSCKTRNPQPLEYGHWPTAHNPCQA